MPDIGRPQQPKKSQFSNIGIKRSALGGGNKIKKSVGDELNQIVGIKPKTKFVNRDEHNKLGKDGFLKLLAHQLKNQDPLKPMDQKEFAADLAQFSQLEQMTNVNANLKKLGGNDVSESKFYGASFLGKEVLTRGTSVNVDGSGKDVELPFYMEKPSKEAMIRVFDKQNQMIAQIDMGQGLGKGSHKIKWDGISQDGTPAVKGDYHFEVYGWDKDFNKFNGETQAKGKVTGVRFEDGDTILKIDGVKDIFLRDVVSFNLPANKKVKKDDTGSNKMPALQKKASNAYNNVKAH